MSKFIAHGKHNAVTFNSHRPYRYAVLKDERNEPRINYLTSEIGSAGDITYDRNAYFQALRLYKHGDREQAHEAYRVLAPLRSKHLKALRVARQRKELDELLKSEKRTVLISRHATLAAAQARLRQTRSIHTYLSDVKEIAK